MKTIFFNLLKCLFVIILFNAVAILIGIAALTVCIIAGHEFTPDQRALTFVQWLHIYATSVGVAVTAASVWVWFNNCIRRQ